MRQAVILLVLSSASCATWQDTVRRGLSGASLGAEQAVVASGAVCRHVTQVCIARQSNPCPALSRCLGIRHQLARAAVLAQLAALAGYVAVDAADKAKASAALLEALRLGAIVKQALDAIKETPAWKPSSSSST